MLTCSPTCLHSKGESVPAIKLSAIWCAIIKVASILKYSDDANDEDQPRYN